MKPLAPSTIALVVLILCAHEISARSSTIVGDIVIESSDKNGNFYCDGLICPENTHSCEVVKRNDPKDFEQLIRVRKCLSHNGTILKDQLVREPNRHHTHVNIHVNSGGVNGISEGRELTPEEERQLQLYLDNLEKNIAAQVEESMSNLNKALKPLQDGSFVADLQSRFGADWQNGATRFNVPQVPAYGTYGLNGRGRFGSDSDNSGLNGARQPVSGESARPSQAGTYEPNVNRRFGSDFDESAFNDAKLDETITPAISRPYAPNVYTGFRPYWDESGFNEAMRPFRDGSFGENLRNEIKQQVSESLRGIFQ